jgi:hypothetical protein
VFSGPGIPSGRFLLPPKYASDAQVLGVQTHKADVPHLTDIHRFRFIALLFFSHISLTSVQAILILAQHEHDFPLKHIVPHQPAADAGDVLVGLDLLELLCQQESGA